MYSFIKKNNPGYVFLSTRKNVCSPWRRHNTARCGVANPGGNLSLVFCVAQAMREICKDDKGTSEDREVAGTIKKAQANACASCEPAPAEPMLQ